ncbi:hypothetical protein TrRE_jg10522, partial [Triparma retinervis]
GDDCVPVGGGDKGGGKGEEKVGLLSGGLEMEGGGDGGSEGGDLEGAPGTIARRRRANIGGAAGEDGGGRGLKARQQNIKVGSAPQDEAHGPDEVTMGYSLSVQWLFLTTALIAFLSDVLVSTIETFTSNLGVNPVFVAAVAVPIVGNAAEHGASVLFAVRGKMDISIAICVGSSIQISLCVLPACVLLGWASGREFTMFFDGYETVCLLISVAVVSFFLQGGTSNWMAGVMMVGMYVMMSMGFWVHEKEEGEWGEDE